MAQNFIESIRDCLDHISQRRRDNGWGGLHIEKLALGSQGNELANGFSGVGGKSECCYAPIQSRLIGMALYIDAHHFASKEICCSGSPKMSILDVSWSVFFKYFAMISNFRVPCNTRHADTLELMRAHSIPLKRSGCELHAHVRGDANLAMGVHPFVSFQ
jgi:hypothetical protein